jgi:hypothetical protein
MQVVSPEFEAIAQGTGQRVITHVEISWDETGKLSDEYGASGWIDETQYLESHEGTMRIEPPGERLVAGGDIGNATVTLRNVNGRFSWRRVDSPLFGYLGGPVGPIGKPVRIWQGFAVDPDVIDPWTLSGDSSALEMVRIFSGYTSGWSESTPSGTVSFSCRDAGWKFIQDKRSTTLYTDQTPEEWIQFIADLVDIETTELDTGLYTIPFVWLDDESAVEEIWQTAEADCGIAYFDELGTLRFENVLHWVGHSVVWDFTEALYPDAEPEHDADDVATKIIIEWNTRSIGDWSEIYRLEGYKEVLPGKTIDWIARFNNAVAEIVDPPNPDKPYEDYRIETTGGLITSDVLVALEDVYAQQCKIKVTNNSTSRIGRVASLRLRGRPLFGGQNEQSEVLVTPKPFTFDRVRSIRGNPYVQTIEQAEALKNVLAIRCRAVRTTCTLNDVPGVPHLQLTDKVTFRDSHAYLGGSIVDPVTLEEIGVAPDYMTGIVTQIRWRGGSQGFRQTITLMDAADMSEYDSYYIIGQDPLGEHERCYY